LLLKFLGATTLIPVIPDKTSQTVLYKGPEYSSYISVQPISDSYYLLYFNFNSFSKSLLNYITMKLYAVYPYLNGFSKPITREILI